MINSTPNVQIDNNQARSAADLCSDCTSTENTIESSVWSDSIPKWFALRCTYGREKKAYDYLCANGIEAYYPTITGFRRKDDKTETIEKSRLPNILFAFATFDQLKVFVYDNFHEETKYLRFYYNHHHDGTKEPLVIP